MKSDAAIDRLVMELTEQGYKLVSESYSARDFGNWFREFHSPDLWVFVLRERGEWSVQAAPSGSALWTGPQEWAACVKGIAVGDVSSPGLLSEFVRSSLPVLRAALLADRSLRSRLEREKREMLARRLGGKVPEKGVGATAVLGPTASSTDASRQAARRLGEAKLKRRKQRQQS